MNYPDSVQFLYALGNELKTAKFGLERITTGPDWPTGQGDDGIPPRPAVLEVT